MNWENLKYNKCPYDNGDLEESPLDFKFYCTSCRFNIDANRKLSIEAHRGNPENKGIKIKWQNLRDEKCPLCASHLSYGTGAYDILACINGDCTFKIRHDRFVEIMADVSHPCNQFYEREKLQRHGIEEE